jgi:hypothetical protein
MGHTLLRLLLLLVIPLALAAVKWEGPFPFPNTLEACKERFPELSPNKGCENTLDGFETVEILNEEKIIASYNMNPCKSEFKILKKTQLQQVPLNEFCEGLLKQNLKKKLRYRSNGCC